MVEKTDKSRIQAIWGAFQVSFHAGGREPTVKYATEGEGHVQESWKIPSKILEQV